MCFCVSAGNNPRQAQAQTGIITTIAGTTPVGGAPQRGFSGDGGPAAAAMLSLANVQTACNPNRKLDGIFLFDEITHLSVDKSGNIYIADSNNQRIRRVAPNGIINTIVGSGQIPALDSQCVPIGGSKDIGDGGPAASAKLYNPAAAIVDVKGDLIIADQQNNRIRRVGPDGTIMTIAGNGIHSPFAPGNPALSSPMDWPSAVAVDSNNTLYFAEIHGHRVGKVGADGKLVAVAGTGFPGYNGDNQPAAAAQLFAPSGIALDAAGNLYIADQSNHRIRKVTPDGMITTIAGTGQPGYAGDGGPAQNARLLYPNDVTLDANGNLYVADMGNNRVRRISRSGTITTVAGDGQSARGPDGVAATASSLALPSGVAIDANGDLYIVDWANYLIRKVSFTSLPSIAPGGVVNGASFAPAPAPVAPGSIISIFGANLAFSTAAASQAPLPVQLAGTSVTVNGAAIPLLFVSPSQINAQLPFEVTPGTAAAVVSTASGASSPAAFNVTSSAVGLFQFPGTNRAIALNQDGSLNSAGNPEMRGNTIVAFLTGQGPVSPPVATGAAAPADPLSQVPGPFTATVGGVPAAVQFLGLTPGFVGLAQANIQIPPGAPVGDQIGMFLSVNGQAGNTATISIR